MSGVQAERDDDRAPTCRSPRRSRGMISTVTRIHVLAAVSVTVAATALAGCAGAIPGQAAAQNACQAYASTGRHQVATTVAQGDAIRATALSDARRAAEADPRWQALQRDIEDFYSRDLSQGACSGGRLLRGRSAGTGRLQVRRRGHRTPPAVGPWSPTTGAAADLLARASAVSRLGCGLGVWPWTHLSAEVNMGARSGRPPGWCRSCDPPDSPPAPSPPHSC